MDGMGTEERTIRPALDWQPAWDYEDIKYELAEGIAKITINRPEVRNAFRPETVIELSDAFERAREDTDVGVIILTGEGPLAFCSGGDQRVRGDQGYVQESTGVGRFHVTDLHVQIRRTPKPVVAMVAGYAVGGGHVLHVICDLSIAAEHARFGQAGPRVGSFDAGFGTGYLARVVGEKRAREIWFLCRQYGAEEAERWGLVNSVVPAAELQAEVRRYADQILALSPTALRFLKQSFNADSEHLAGQAALAFSGLEEFVHSDEAREGLAAFDEKRPPDFGRFR
jgi:naphthoate synthase